MMIAITLLISMTTMILIAGVIVMAIGGKLDQKYATKLMSARVLFQAVVIIFLFLMFLIFGNS